MTSSGDDRTPVMHTTIGCFKCGKRLEAAFQGKKFHDGDCILQPSDGIMFTSPGNYGSTVWDPQSHLLSMHILICDECIREGAQGSVLIVERIPQKDALRHWSLDRFLNVLDVLR